MTEIVNLRKGRCCEKVLNLQSVSEIVALMHSLTDKCSFPALISEKRTPGNTNARREMQMHTRLQARALNFDKFSGSDKAKEVTKIIGSILL